MSQLEMLDTFADFEEMWQRRSSLPTNAQVEAWEREYMSRYPELLRLQLADYAEEGLDWKEIARERIFPNLEAHLPAMQMAHANLVEICEGVFYRACSLLETELDAVFVIYVGIGCGAGWVTRYAGKPAILFGLENVAEEGWASKEILSGLSAHEIGHLAHFHWLEQAQVSKGEGKWWQLFEEGFAQRCEHVILGKETWHMACGEGVEGWLDWCRSNRSWLAGEYLRCLQNDLPVKAFFGSWFNIDGFKQTGYYLGHEVVRQMEERHSLRQIALLPDLEARIIAILESLQDGKTA